MSRETSKIPFNMRFWVNLPISGVMVFANLAVGLRTDTAWADREGYQLVYVYQTIRQMKPTRVLVQLLPARKEEVLGCVVACYGDRPEDVIGNPLYEWLIGELQGAGWYTEPHGLLAAPGAPVTEDAAPAVPAKVRILG